MLCSTILLPLTISADIFKELKLLTFSSCAGGSAKTEDKATTADTITTHTTTVAQADTTADASATTVTEPAKPIEAVLTKVGYGLITIGMAKADVPEAVPGCYDSRKWNASDYDGNVGIKGWYECKLDGTTVLCIFANSTKVCGMSIHGKNMKTDNGLYVGMSYDQAAALGLSIEANEMEDNTYYANGFSFWTNDNGRISSIGIGDCI